MKRIALVMAGGIGARTGQNVPKQYLTVYDTPILFYTLKNIENSNTYDEIYVVGAEGWKDFIYSYAKQYNINSFKGIVPAGSNRFESCYNGVNYLSTKENPATIISIMDGNRALTPVDLFSKSIEVLEKSQNNDCVLLLEPCYEAMYIADEKNNVNGTIPRQSIFVGQNPETTYLSVAKEILEKAKEDNLTNLAFSEMMLYCNKRVKYIQGSVLNFKITTLDDLLIFKSLVSDKKLNPIENSK